MTVTRTNRLMLGLAVLILPLSAWGGETLSTSQVFQADGWTGVVHYRATSGEPVRCEVRTSAAGSETAVSLIREMDDAAFLKVAFDPNAVPSPGQLVPAVDGRPVRGAGPVDQAEGAVEYGLGNFHGEEAQSALRTLHRGGEMTFEGDSGSLPGIRLAGLDNALEQLADCRSWQP